MKRENDWTLFAIGSALLISGHFNFPLVAYVIIYALLIWWVLSWLKFRKTRVEG